MTSTNDGKDVKSNQTTGPKGKTYYIELYKSLESRLSESTEPSERTKHLCDAWRRVHSLCQHSAPSTHVHLLSWLQRHTARTVLQTGWQLPKREGDRKHLEDAINDFIAQSREAQASRVGEPLPWEAQLATRGEWFKTIIDKPWDHPVLTLLLNPNGTPPSDDEVLKWLKEERGVTFVMRLHTLVGEKCEDIACSLAACVMDRVRAAAPALCDAGEDDDKASTAPYTGPFADKLRDEAGFTVDVWEMLTDIEFVLQHKRDSQRCIALAKQTPLRGAYQLIERLHSRLETSPREKRLWKTAKQVAILIAHVVIARCMVIPLCSGVARSALYCCARSLAHRAPARLLSAGAALAAPAPTARHLHTFAAAVRAHLPPGNDQVMKPFVCELYVRAITAGMNELEKLKLKTEKEAEGQARASAQTLAAWMLQLGSVVSGSRVAAECALTAFSLHPSGHMYECLVSVPPQVKHNDPKEPKEEATTSEFGSWANDSRSMTNFVKTSETLNMKHTQNQANILSTAILNEGEGLGLSPDLCQDIAVLLSGPRVKTFSWDMEREELLEKCRTYMERTHGGTRALTTELKYLNLDPANFQHLPEDRDDDEDDIYYGIEKGYEHLVQFEEPEEIWNAPQEPDRIDTTSPSFLDDEIIPHRKKKNRRVPHSSNEDSDPLSTVAETKRHQKNKERPHSKERSRKDKKEKKKQEVDPLLPEDQTQEQKSQKIKEKKERKKKEKTPRDSSLASLVGLKVGKSRNKKKTKESALSIINSDYNKQGKTSFQSLNSEISDADDINIDVTTVDDNKSDKGNKVGIIGMPSQSGKKPPNNIDNFTYKPWLPAPTYRPSSSGLSRKHSPGMKAFPDEIRASISKLLEFRRQKAMEPNINRQPKMNAHMVQRNATNAIVNTPDVQIQTNITPKAVIIPDIPKSYIDKQKAEQLAEFKKGVDMIISQGNQMMETRHDSHPVVHKPVIQYAKKNKTKPHVLDVMKLNTESQLAHSNSLKMSDIVNVSSDRMILEKMQRQNSCSAIYDIVRPPRPTSSVSNIAQERPASVAMSGQNDYLNFLKEYQLARNKAIRNTAMTTMATSTEQVLDMSTKASKDIKKDVKPLSRVTPIVPDINKAERKPQQCAKPLTQQKKPEASLNTFSRLSYMHKNKQTEMKNKSATENPTLNFTTYQEVSTELDEIIRKHKNEQMKVIQAKNDKLVRAKETPSSSSKSIIEDSRKSLNSLTQALSHPMLSNLLEQNTITYASSPSVCQNQSKFKNTSPKKSVLPAKSSLTTSDQNDLLNLLRQQSKLNSGFYQTTSMYPSTSNSIDNVSTPANNSTSYPKQKIVTPTKAVNIQSSLETKIINIISNSLTKPPDNLILKNGSGVKSKPLILSGKKNAKDPDNVKKTETDKTQAKKPTIISDARNHNNWESVMNDILKHKTPRRGPNALDVALNKSSYEKAFENSLKKPSTMPVIINTISEDRKYPIKSQPSNSVIPQNSNKAKILKQPSIQTKAIDLKKSVIQSKSESSGTKKATKVNSSEMSKKLPHDQQRKQFTYTGPKHDDPFISGIPNSDYDLLEELMDDDLRKEIGELSSDEEGFNTAAQSFLKTPKNDEKRVSVEFNPPLPEVSAKKPVTDIRCLNTSHSNDENIHTTTQSLVKNSENTIPQANNSVRQPQGLAVNVTKDNTCMKDMVPQSIPTNVATIPNYTNVNALTNTQIDRNIYITSVPQQSPVQNVVLIGSELVYEGYSTIQTPINNIVSNIVPNTYVAVNNTPNMTLYQSTPFAAPVVNPMLIGNATLSVPIINTIPCAATISVQPTPINQVSETVFHASTLGSHTQINSANVNVEKRDDNIGTLTSDPILHNDIKSVNERLLDLNIKTNERKVLSEVQERLVVTENTEKVRTQVTDYEKNLRKDVSDDRERLKKKRMAIINRDIYHRCGDTPIALSYSPLPPPKALLDTHTEVVPETLTSVSCLPQAATNLENNVPNKEESLPNTEVKSQSNIDDDIKDLASPVTPDNNDNCKENKSNPKVPCRRILLRSSNKIKSKPDIDTAITENPKRKSKVKLKAETPKCDEEADNISSQNKNICKDASVPKRASKRLRNKTLKRNQNNIIKGKIENQEKINKKLSSKKTNHNVTESSNNIIEDGLLDIEAELQGARIPTIPVILPKVNVAEIKQSQQEDIVPSDYTISDEVTASNEKGNIIPSPETDEILEQTTDSEINDISNEVIYKHLNFETDANTIISNENPKNIVQLKSQIEKIEVSDDSAVNVETEVMLKILTQQNKTVETQSSNLQSVNDSNSFQSDHIIKTTAKTAFSLTDSTKVTNDNNSDNLSENNNIDLDMTVTCEEANAAQKIPVIAGIKYGKDTNICNKIIKQNQNSQVLKINQNETTSTLDSPVSDINSDSKNVTSVDTVLESIKTTDTESQCYEKVTGKKPLEASFLNANKTSNLDDDIQIIDDNLNQSSPIANCDKVKKESNTNHQTMTKPNSEVTNTSVATVSARNDDPKIISDLSEVSQSYKDSVIIEELPSVHSGAVTKKCVRVKLPNGRTFKATVYGEVHGNFDTLFANPSIKSALLNSLNSKKRYTMNIKQVSTVANGDPSRILSTRIQAFKPMLIPPPPGQVETIDLLSDDEEVSHSTELNYENQALETEYGRFKISNISEIDKNILAGHKIKLRHKAVVALKRIDETTNKDVYLSLNSKIPGKTLENTDSVSAIADKTVSVLKDDIKVTEHKTTSGLKNTIDVVEIDDSSNDGSDIKCSAKVQSESKINELKDVLLQELGVNSLDTSITPHKVKDGKNINISEEIISIDDDDDLPNEQPNCNSMSSKSSERFNKNKRKNNIIDKICCVKLTRCDDLIEKSLSKTTEILNYEDKARFDSVCSSVQAFETQDGGDKNSDNTSNYVSFEDFSLIDFDTNAIEPEAERSSSPVIELFDVIASLHCSYLTKSELVLKSIPLSCEAEWLTSKRMLQLRTVNYLASIPINQDNRVNGKGNININNLSDMPAANTLEEKQPPVKVVPRLISMVLKLLQDTDAIYQYKFFRGSLNLSAVTLKRKSSSLQPDFKPKMSRLEVTNGEEQNTSDNLISSNSTLDSSATYNNVSISILEDVNSICILEASNINTSVDNSDLSLNKTDVSTCTSTCDGDRYLNEQGCDKANDETTEACSYEDLKNMPSLSEAVSKVSDLIDADFVIEPRSSSPVIEISHLLLDDYINDIDNIAIPSPKIEIKNIPSLLIEENNGGGDKEPIESPKLPKYELELESKTSPDITENELNDAQINGDILESVNETIPLPGPSESDITQVSGLNEIIEDSNSVKENPVSSEIDLDKNILSTEISRENYFKNREGITTVLSVSTETLSPESGIINTAKGGCNVAHKSSDFVETLLSVNAEECFEGDKETYETELIEHDLIVNGGLDEQEQQVSCAKDTDGTSFKDIVLPVDDINDTTETLQLSESTETGVAVINYLKEENYINIIKYNNEINKPVEFSDAGIIIDRNILIKKERQCYDEESHNPTDPMEFNTLEEDDVKIEMKKTTETHETSTYTAKALMVESEVKVSAEEEIHAVGKTHELSGYRERYLPQESGLDERKENEVDAAGENLELLDTDSSIKVIHDQVEEVHAVEEPQELSGFMGTDLSLECGLHERKEEVYASTENHEPLYTDSSIKDTNIEAAEIYTVGGTHKLSGCRQTDLSQECGFDESKEQDGDYAAREKLKPLDTDSSNEVTHDDAKKIHAGVETDEISGFRESGLSQECRTEDRKEDEVYAAREISKPLDKESIKVSHNEAEEINAVGEIHELSGLKETDLLKECGLEEIKKDGVYADRENTKPLDTDSSIKVTRDKAEEIHAVEETHELSGFMETDLSLECGLHKAEEEVYASSIKYTNIEAKDEDIAARENIKLLDNDSANEVMKLKDEAHEEAKKMHADVGTQGLFVFSEGGLSQKCGLEERKEDVECDLDGIKEDGVYEANENSKPLDTESFKVAHDAKEINVVRETLFRKTDLSQECSLNGRKEKDEVYAATENCEPLATDSSMKDTLYEAENINNVKFDDQLSGDMQTVLLLERGMNDNKVENEILQSEDTDLIVKSVIKDQLIDDGDIDITYPSSNLIEFDTSVKSKDNGDDFKDCVETYQLVKVTKSDLSLENDAKDNETTTGTIKINKNEQSQIDQSIQTRDVMVIQNSSSVRGFIMDHEYITSISVACEDRRCTQKVDDTIQLPSHCPILIFDDEATEEITEEIVEFLSDEVIDDITLHNDTVSNDSRQTDDNASQESVISSFDNGAEIHNIDESTSEKNIGDDSMNNSDSMEPLDSKDEDLEDTGAIWKVSVRNIDNVEETSFTSCDISTEGIINKYLASLGKDQSDLAHTVNKFKYEDPEAGTCFILPIIEKKIETNNVVREKVQDSYKVDVNSEESNDPFVIDTDEDLKCILPERTYSKYKREIRRSKRRMNMSDITFCGKRIRYGPRRNSKTIDYPKPSKIDEISYAKEYKTLFDYCSTIHFSYSIPFHKEYIDVHKELESWPIKGNCIVVEDIIDSEMLFRDTPDGSFNPIQLSLAEEIKVEFDENDYKSINIVESNFSMGFGDGSGRVKQEQRDGEYTFSAATLSDVKQIQPHLPSEEKHKSFRVENPSGIVDNNQDLYKMRRFYDYLHLKEKVRSFFEKTKTELSSDWAENHKKNYFRNKNVPENWPFCLASPEYMQPAPVSVTVNVVQVGQLPVSAAAQNPVTCDPRVTHVSNVSPSQCSPQNNSGDDLQTSIKSEYTELTTADITLPLMQEYVQHHHSMPNKSQETTNMHSCDDNIPMATEIKSVVKIELMEETSQDQLEENIRYETHRLQLSENNVSNGSQYHYDNITSKMVLESDANVQSVINSSEDSKVISKSKQPSDSEKTDQIAHAMNAAGITATQEKTTDAEALVDIISQNAQSNVLALQTSNYSKPTPITTMALQQALAQILPPPLNQTNASENNQPNTTNPQVLHIVQGNSTPSVINKTSGPQLLHIVQNKNNTNGTPASQPNTFSGLSLVDGAIQQNGNLLHIVNTGQKNSNNPGQLLKRVNLLTNLANVQGSNDKMVHVLCKSTDGKSIQLPPQRSMVLRLQPLDPPNLQATAKQNEVQDVNPSNSALPANSANGKETAQEIKSRSLYEENYAKFVQNGDPKPGQEKATSLPKFNQVFGKQVYQDKQDEVDSNNLSENQECQQEENMPLEQMTDIGSPPMLIQKPQSQTATPQPNLVQQIKQSIGPMNIPMHGGVIYTRQIPVNIGNGQTINLITVPSTEIVDDSNQKLNADGKFGNQEGNSQIIKIVTNNQPATTANGASDDNNTQLGPTNEAKPQQNPQPQPVLTQMRIKLPMLSKAPQMVGGTRVVRPSFFQIQRNVIGGANQQVYQQLVLTAAPQIGQSIRLPAQVLKPKTPSETQSSSESQMSSSTLEQLREFDMVLEQVKERSTVQPGSSTSNNNFSKLNSSADTTDTATPSTSTLKQDPPTPVLFSVGTTQPINIANFVNRKSTITSTTTSSFVRSPDSTGIAESPTSSTHVHLPHTVQPTTESCASSSCASEAAAATTSQPKPKKKSKPKSSSSSNPFKINSTPPKTSTQKPLEDEQTTQRILYILAEYKEQVENSPDKDKPAPRRRNNPAAPAAGTSKRKKSSSGSRKRDSSPIGEDSCRTMGSEDSSCGTSLGECNECLESHSPEESPRKVVRRLTFEQETTQVTQTRTTTTTIPQRNVIVADGQAFAVRSTAGKPATTVLMPANYLLPVSMVKGGQQIAIVTNRGPKLLVGAGEGGSGGTLLFQRLIGPAGLKPVLTRPGVRHIRLPTAALHNLQTFNIATPAATVQPPDSTASPAPPAPAPPDLVDTRAMSSPWTDRTSEGETKQDKGNSSPEGSEPWNLPSSSIADDYGYEEIVRTDNMDRTVLVVQRKDGRHHRLTHVSAAALRHKYAILEHELRLQKSLSEECEDLGVDSPSASELFPEAELLFAPSPAHEQTIDQCHTPQPLLSQGIPQPDLDDQIASDGLLTHDRQNELDINLDDVGEIVTVGEDGMTTIQLDHEEFARSHPNTTFHSEPEDGEMPPFTIAQGLKSRPISFVRGVPGTVVMAPQTTVISQATVEPVGTQNTVKFTDIDNIINAMPSPQHNQNIMPSVLVKDDLHKFDNILNEREVLPTSAIVHSTGNVTQVIRRAETRDRFSTEDDILRRHDKVDDRESNGDSGPERPSELFWNNTRQDRRFNFDKCCKYDESDVNNTRLDSVIKAARRSDSPSDAPPLRTYPARRSHIASPHTSHNTEERSRPKERCHDEGRRRASNRGVVKRGCHCCNGSTAPPKPKKSKKRPDFHNH